MVLHFLLSTLAHNVQYRLLMFIVLPSLLYSLLPSLLSPFSSVIRCPPPTSFLYFPPFSLLPPVPPLSSLPLSTYYPLSSPVPLPSFLSFYLPFSLLSPVLPLSFPPLSALITRNEYMLMTQQYQMSLVQLLTPGTTSSVTLDPALGCGTEEGDAKSMSLSDTSGGGMLCV